MGSPRHEEGSRLCRRHGKALHRSAVAEGERRPEAAPALFGPQRLRVPWGAPTPSDRYAKYDFLEEKREALDLWGRRLATLLNASFTPQVGRVIPRQQRTHRSHTRDAELAGRQSRLFGSEDA